MIDAYDIVLRTIIEQKCAEMGICSLFLSSDEIVNAFRQLPEDEVRTMKRRFRKLWRKEKKKKMGRFGPGHRANRIHTSYGHPGRRCGHTQAWNRRNVLKIKFMEPYEKQLEELYKIIHGDRWSFND
jgi:hypothetical protein